MQILFENEPTPNGLVVHDEYVVTLAGLNEESGRLLCEVAPDGQTCRIFIGPRSDDNGKEEELTEEEFLKLVSIEHLKRQSLRLSLFEKIFTDG